MDQPNNLAALKAAFLAMSATAGWPYFCRFAERVIQDLERAAIDEADDVKASGLRRDARGARKFWDDLKTRVELAKTQPTEPTEDPADEFYAILEKLNGTAANA